MLNINFVPDDYVQTSESHRTNMMYLVLFAVVMVGLGGSFAIIRVRQRALDAKEKLVNADLAKAQEAIKQFEELQMKRKTMMKTALTTAELLEPVPRSVLLASLTNNLPKGVSLLQLKFVQKKSKDNRLSRGVTATSKYQATQSAKTAADQPRVSPEKMLETSITIAGLAPSDLQVAAYIKQLSNSCLLDRVALVESRERKTDDTTSRQFKLTAMLKKDVHLTEEDINKIRSRCERTARTF